MLYAHKYFISCSLQLMVVSRPGRNGASVPSHVGGAISHVIETAMHLNQHMVERIVRCSVTQVNFKLV